MFYFVSRLCQLWTQHIGHNHQKGSYFVFTRLRCVKQRNGFFKGPRKGEKRKKRGALFLFFFKVFHFASFLSFFPFWREKFLCLSHFFFLVAEGEKRALSFCCFWHIKKKLREGSHDPQTKLGFSRKEESWQKNAKTNCFLVFRNFLGRRAK